MSLMRMRRILRIRGCRTDAIGLLVATHANALVGEDVRDGRQPVAGLHGGHMVDM
jgi:hypothetical protein